MFQSARVKLTLWYLIIIMIVSGFFSLIVYRGFSKELGRGFRYSQHMTPQRRVLVQESNGFLRILPFMIYPDENAPEEYLEIISLAKHRFALQLLIINFGILFLAGIAGYFLAGKTLRPIEIALNEQKRFIADASHEFKTPLTALQTSIEVTLRDKKLGLKDAKKVLKESLDDIGSLSSLSNYLLSLARFQKDNNFAKENIFMKDIFEGAVKKVSPLLKKKNIVIKTDVADNTIYANRESLEKLITLLLDNAIKYTPAKGSVNITAKKEKKNTLIKISDTGIGISKADLPHIFERFYRADTSRSKEDTSGFGLGLSMAKQIVDLHKGSIVVESTVGKGSSFIVTLPNR